MQTWWAQAREKSAEVGSIFDKVITRSPSVFSLFYDEELTEHNSIRTMLNQIWLSDAVKYQSSYAHYGRYKWFAVRGRNQALLYSEGRGTVF